MASKAVATFVGLLVLGLLCGEVYGARLQKQTGGNTGIQLGGSDSTGARSPDHSRKLLQTVAGCCPYYQSGYEGRTGIVVGLYCEYIDIPRDPFARPSPYFLCCPPGISCPVNRDNPSNINFPCLGSSGPYPSDVCVTPPPISTPSLFPTPTLSPAPSLTVPTAPAPVRVTSPGPFPGPKPARAAGAAAPTPAKTVTAGGVPTGLLPGR